jgi:glucosamine kinase
MGIQTIVIGLDGGGTYTRALCADLTGHVLAYMETGGANPSHNADAEQNVQAAVAQVIEQAGHTPAHVVSLVAGLAGLDEPDDLVWAERFTTVTGMTICPTCVNDAVVAHAGALRSRPGIIAIAGTGSIIFGVTETGRHIRNYDFYHYGSNARHLAYDTVYRILAGEAQAADAAFVQQVLSHFGLSDIRGLAELAATNVHQNRQELNRQYGNLAPHITAAAVRNEPLAYAACTAAGEALTRGIRLLGSMFVREAVECALIGSVIRSPTIKQQLTTALAQPANKQYTIVEPALSPSAGAVLMALQQQGVTVDDALCKTLGAHPAADFRAG